MEGDDTEANALLDAALATTRDRIIAPPRSWGRAPRRRDYGGRTTPWGGTYTMCHLSLTWTSDRATSKGEQMSEANWQQARLIPTSGINGSDEAERRATSGLLAVMRAVREFGLAVVKPLGAPAAQLECF